MQKRTLLIIAIIMAVATLSTWTAGLVRRRRTQDSKDAILYWCCTGFWFCWHVIHLQQRRRHNRQILLLLTQKHRCSQSHTLVWFIYIHACNAYCVSFNHLDHPCIEHILSSRNCIYHVCVTCNHNHHDNHIGCME